jgi:hypothetical protein
MAFYSLQNQKQVIAAMYFQTSQNQVFHRQQHDGIDNKKKR